jgi:Putative sensor
MSSRERAQSSGGSLISVRHNPVGLIFSASLWRSAGYLLGYLLVSGALFAIALTSITAALALSVTIVAIPLLIGAAFVVRGCAELERARLRQVLFEPVRGCYRPSDGRGLWQQARARWGESTTWRDLAYLLGLWPLLFTLDAVVLAAWLCCLAGVALPLWYSHVAGVCVGDCTPQGAAGVLIGYFPHGARGTGSQGLYVDSLHTALLAAAGFAVLVLLLNYVLVGTARLHAQIAGALLRRPADPLAPARAVLAGPRPLGPLVGSALSGDGQADHRLHR